MPIHRGQGHLRASQVERLLNAPPASIDDVIATRDRCLLMLLCTTGMRISEIARIDTRDVSARAITSVRRGPHVPGRSVPISPEVYEAIQDWLYVRPVQGPYLFMPTTRIEAESLWWELPLTLGSIHHMVAHYGEAVGIVSLCTYDLRCYAAHTLYQRGLAYAARVLGHANPASTVKMLDIVADETVDTNHLY